MLYGLAHTLPPTVHIAIHWLPYQAGVSGSRVDKGVLRIKVLKQIKQEPLIQEVEID